VKQCREDKKGRRNVGKRVLRQMKASVCKIHEDNNKLELLDL
jgi:hypothetical protein